MNLLRSIFRRRSRGVDRTPGTYVMEAAWERSEELRPDRLGPSQDDVEDPERVQVERWRPSRSLGPTHWS
jgi:hypothetical protein